MHKSVKVNILIIFLLEARLTQAKFSFVMHLK